MTVRKRIVSKPLKKIIIGFHDDGVIAEHDFEEINEAMRGNDLNRIVDAINGAFVGARGRTGDLFPGAVVRVSCAALDANERWGDKNLHYGVLEKYAEGMDLELILRDFKMECKTGYIETIVVFYLGKIFVETAKWDIASAYARGQLYEFKGSEADEKEVKGVASELVRSRRKECVGVLKKCIERYMASAPEDWA